MTDADGRADDAAADAPADERLLLLAQDADEVPLLSGLMQGAIVARTDLAYDRRARRLVLLATRYRWEAVGRTRIRTALRIQSVTAVQRRGWTDANADDPGPGLLELLAFALDDGVLTVTFAAGKALRVAIECVDLVLEDVSGPWRVANAPVHD